jgi:hypothetical protein
MCIYPRAVSTDAKKVSWSYAQLDCTLTCVIFIENMSIILPDIIIYNLNL